MGRVGLGGSLKVTKRCHCDQLTSCRNTEQDVCWLVSWRRNVSRFCKTLSRASKRSVHNRHIPEHLLIIVHSDGRRSLKTKSGRSWMAAEKSNPHLANRPTLPRPCPLDTRGRRTRRIYCSHIAVQLDLLKWYMYEEIKLYEVVAATKY